MRASSCRAHRVFRLQHNKCGIHKRVYPGTTSVRGEQRTFPRRNRLLAPNLSPAPVALAVRFTIVLTTHTVQCSVSTYVENRSHRRSISMAAAGRRCRRLPVQLVRPLHPRAAGTTTNSFGSSLPSVVAAGGWDAAWRQAITPWDAGGPSPQLAALLSSPVLASTGSGAVRTALVPGCGAGYDAVAFAQAGFDTLGVDLSPTAIDLCREGAPAVPSAPLKLEFRVADFFALAGTYHVIYDYTFLSALPPELWPAWAAAMRRLVAPDGLLITQLFPIGFFKGGPPYALSADAVRGLLEAAAFTCVSLEPVAPALSHPARAVSWCSTGGQVGISQTSYRDERVWKSMLASGPFTT